MKLEEGKRYEFLVQKTLFVGDNEYYLLEGPGGEKCLLPLDPYKEYNIKINRKVDCRVDKINCRGEVFLEPANPFYAEGEKYNFEVSGRDIRLDEKGEMTPVLLVRDKFENELVVPMRMIDAYDAARSKYVNLRISRIIKGRIFFTEPLSLGKGEKIEEEDLMDFYIYDKRTGIDGKAYFMISDKDNEHHLLPAGQYSYYGLEKGKTFKGRLIKYHSTGKARVEPVNPYYEKGREYEFELISLSPGPGNKGKILVVGDRHGLKHEVFVPEDFKPAKKLTFRVEKIRKGWPLLAPL